MSASGSSSVPTAKLQDHSQQGGEAAKDANAPQTGPAQLEEDDEFEDFPVEGMCWSRTGDQQTLSCGGLLVDLA